ncbi:hypothetical protein T440DRAFT_464096 [Plenodomus tracheiphilus IPT5]|uniref:F-box domain-containing protein n=1 Tax=Plenodomus tracheiphilus IPT5 TaxID=1408161 RepID=A0A6A7BLM5_9PLEO|nr:hypothetical protein T440DRAFT_464096 [Plenodomus tracheiphilus IPT5]
MSPPSYARATASSTMKSSPKSQKTTPTLKSQTTTPNKLKRPSLLTNQERQLKLYQRNLIPINPHDPHAPCPISNLPSEIRALIYTHVFSQAMHPMTIYNRPTDTFEFIWPAILQVCRAIRVEASYTYFTITPFTFHIRNLRFILVQKWVGSLNPEHRRLLARNRRLLVEMAPQVIEKFTWPPKGFLLDDYMEGHWKACEKFGNLYTIESEENRRQFILFCRLAGWWSWCAQSKNQGIVWKYECGPCETASGRRELLFWFLVKDICGAITAWVVRKAWTRNLCGGKMKQAAMKFLDDVEGHVAFHALPQFRMRNQITTMERARGVIEKW